MSSVRYLNQSGPVWDFIASLEEHGSNHPLFAAFDTQQGDEGEAYPPWGWGGRGRGFRGHSHGGRGGRGGPRGGHHHGGSHERRGMSPGRHGSQSDHHERSRHGPGSEHGGRPSHERGGPSHEGHHPPPPKNDHRPRSRSPSPERGNRRGSRGPGHGGPPQHDGRPRFVRGGRCGQGDFGTGSPFNLSGLAEFFQSQIYGDNDRTCPTQAKKAETSGNEFEPPVDVFDTEAAFVVHVSLAGANKEKDDIAVNWDHEKSELSISGVIYRPGNEEFLQTLALDERQQGAFSRKIRLGSRAHPAQVDADGISAKLEDGLLRITVPKEDKDYVEIKVVDIE